MKAGSTYEQEYDCFTAAIAVRGPDPDFPGTWECKIALDGMAVRKARGKDSAAAHYRIAIANQLTGCFFRAIEKMEGEIE
jgi:hypothetical protein